VNDKEPLRLRDEPDDHGLGRSRGGLSTKLHLVVDGAGRPLVIAVAAGQGGDSPMLVRLLGQLSVPRAGPGRPRTRPDSLAADKAYSSKAIRAHLRSRRITAVIPEPADQIGHRRRRGSAGGRPVAFDPVAYRGRNVIERAFNRLKQWRGIATRYDKHPATYRRAVVLASILTWLQQ
jgi:putative transposase